MCCHVHAKRRDRLIQAKCGVSQQAPQDTRTGIRSGSPVPTSMKLNQLHHVVQAAMGWLDRHLWMLTAGDRSYGVFIPGEDDWNERIDDAETTTLATILSGGLKE